MFGLRLNICLHLFFLSLNFFFNSAFIEHSGDQGLCNGYKNHSTVLYSVCKIAWQKNSYAAGLIKASAKIIGKSAGNISPALTMPTDAEVAELEKIILQNK